MNFAKFQITHFLAEYIQWLLLKIVETAYVCIIFFFCYLKYQNIFSKRAVLYLIANVERKEKTFHLKHEIIDQNYLVSERKEKQNFSG